jgi:hypothetical protein
MPAFESFFKGYMHLAVHVRGFFRWASINVNKEDIDIDYAEL